MRRPNTKELMDWWDAQEEKDYTCGDCGRVDRKAYVQPQHPYYTGGRVGLAYCADCIAEQNSTYRARRKAELEAMPRCQVPGCNRRGVWKALGVLLCGRHLKKAKMGAQDAGLRSGLPFFYPISYTPADVLKWAKE